jgi:hypothetical protein
VAKTPSLLDAVKKLPDKKSGKLNWISRMEETDASLYAEMIGIVDRWMGGDVEIRRKLPSQAAVSEWLAPLLAERGFELKPHTICQVFVARKSHGKTAQR